MLSSLTHPIGYHTVALGRAKPPTPRRSRSHRASNTPPMVTPRPPSRAGSRQSSRLRARRSGEEETPSRNSSSRRHQHRHDSRHRTRRSKTVDEADRTTRDRARSDSGGGSGDEFVPALRSPPQVEPRDPSPVLRRVDQDEPQHRAEMGMWYTEYTFNAD